MPSPIMEFFRFEHLPPKLQEASRPFGELAAQVDAVETRHHAEKATALRKLLEAKDAAVRCLLPVLLVVVALGCLLVPGLARAQDTAAPPAPSPILTAVLQYVVPALVTVLGPLAIWALGQLAAFLRAKASESKVFGVLSVVTEAANSVVAELNVTLKPQLQAALADGVLTDAEKKQLKEAALVVLKTKLPAATLQSAQGLFGPMLDTWLGGLVERAVQEQKPRTLEEAAAILRTAPAAS
jgi:hypothetical protein